MALSFKEFSFHKLFKRKSAKSGTVEFGRNARMDWEIACFAFLFLTLLAIGMSLFVYGEINNGELFLVDKKEKVPLRTIDKFELERTISYFTSKEEKFEALKRRPLSTIDPFIPKPVQKKK